MRILVRKMRYWLIPGWYERWIREFGREKKYWGVRTRVYNKLRTGDKIIIYSSRQKSGFFAHVTASSDYRIHPDPTDEYPHEFDFEIDYVLERPISPKSLFSKLNFMRGKNFNNYGMVFFHCRELSFSDYELIKHYMDVEPKNSFYKKIK
jgi:predicted RNA-binding protein